MELYIIRHAQSYNNSVPESQRVTDPPLTDLGKQQAELLAQYLANGQNRDPWIDITTGNWRKDQTPDFGFTHLYCSAMYRSLQTAAPIGRLLNLKPEVWIDIHEHGGMYLEQPDGIVGAPGKNRSEILSEFPDYVLPDTITEVGWYDPNSGQESLSKAQGRAINVAGELWRRAHSDDRIAIVSHGTFIDALLKALFNQLPNHSIYYSHYNTAISRIDFFAERRGLFVRHLNRIAHLPVEMIT